MKGSPSATVKTRLVLSLCEAAQSGRRARWELLREDPGHSTRVQECGGRGTGPRTGGGGFGSKGLHLSGLFTCESPLRPLFRVSSPSLQAGGADAAVSL